MWVLVDFNWKCHEQNKMICCGKSGRKEESCRQASMLLAWTKEIERIIASISDRMKFFKTLTKGSWRFQWVVYFQFRFISIMNLGKLVNKFTLCSCTCCWFFWHLRRSIQFSGRWFCGIDGYGELLYPFHLRWKRFCRNAWVSISRN